MSTSDPDFSEYFSNNEEQRCLENTDLKLRLVEQQTIAHLLRDIGIKWTLTLHFLKSIRAVRILWNGKALLTTVLNYQEILRCLFKHISIRKLEFSIIFWEISLATSKTCVRNLHITSQQLFVKDILISLSNFNGQEQAGVAIKKF